MTNIVAIQNISLSSQLEQLAFEFVGNRGFACAGEARQPNNASRMAIPRFPLLGGNLAAAPVEVLTLVMGTVAAARIVVVRDNSTATHVVAVYYHKPAGRGHVAMDIKCHRTLCLNDELGDLMASDELLVRTTLKRIQRGSVDHFLYRLDIALDLLCGEFELVRAPLGEWSAAEPEQPGLEP